MSVKTQEWELTAGREMFSPILKGQRAISTQHSEFSLYNLATCFDFKGSTSHNNYWQK